MLSLGGSLRVYVRAKSVDLRKAHDALCAIQRTAKAAGIDTRDYFKNVLLRLSTCTDVKQLTPHGWREHFAAEVADRRHALLQQIVGKA